MKVIRFIVCSLALFLFSFPSTSSQAQNKPTIELKPYYMILFLHPDGKQVSGNINAQHFKYIESLAINGRAVAVGNILDETLIRGIIITDEQSKDRVQEMANADPAVKSGQLAAKVLVWMTGKTMLQSAKAETPLSMVNYYFGIVRAGAKSTPEVTPETEKLLQAHVATVIKLASTGKLVLAGHFIEGGDFEGVVVFKVDSLEEAKSLADADPPVKAGYMAIDLYRIAVPKGMLP